MKRRLPRRLLAALSLFLPLFTAQACGPDFYPDVFVHKLRPDKPKEFAQGKLGLLLPTYPRTDLIVAYRYLTGGNLTPAEQSAYQPTYGLDDQEEPSAQTQCCTSEDAGPVKIWTEARSHFAAPLSTEISQNREVEIPQQGGWTMRWSYLNCNDDAFETAAATLQSRSATWGPKSSDLADWIKGQDAVFANCSAKVPISPPAVSAGASPLLRYDRAYQTAAAQFYAGQFDAADDSFAAIGQDGQSPWHGLAQYLVARCLVRKAFFAKPNANYGHMASYDPEIMQQAATVLRALLKQKPSGISHQAIENELDLIRFRLEPEARLKELSAALSGPKADTNYAQHLHDLTWHLDMKLDEEAIREDSNKADLPAIVSEAKNAPPAEDYKASQFSAAFSKAASLRATSPLVDWLLTFQSPAKEASTHAAERWNSTHQPEWLLAAITKTNQADHEAANLIESAAKIPQESPVWESVTYHRIRLLIALDRDAEARATLNQVMPQIQAAGRDSSINAFTGLRMAAAHDLKEFLAYAPRKMLNRTSESQAALDECIDVMKNPKRNYDCRPDKEPNQFSEDAASILNSQMPLGTLVEMVESKQLPQPLSRSVALMAWVRSILLKDDAAAARLYPLLPDKLKEQSGGGTGFHSLMTLARNPGLRPYLDPGVQRSYSYDFVESYADNWWCKEWRTPFDSRGTSSLKVSVSFLTLEQKSQGRKETATVAEQGGAEVYLGSEILAYANSHPEDSDIPESLYLVLRMIRYGCERAVWSGDTTSKQVSRQDEIRASAARLLRQRYPASQWTKKAAPFVR